MDTSQAKFEELEGYYWGKSSCTQDTVNRPIQRDPDKYDGADMLNVDNVNHPSHYETGKFECIDVMLEVFGKNAVMQFCRCNAFKYLYRMDRKNGYEDIQKAKWYIDKFIELMEN